MAVLFRFSYHNGKHAQSHTWFNSSSVICMSGLVALWYRQQGKTTTEAFILLFFSLLTKRGAKNRVFSPARSPGFVWRKDNKAPPPIPPCRQYVQRHTEIHTNTNSQLTVQLSIFIGTHTHSRSLSCALAHTPAFFSCLQIKCSPVFWGSALPVGETKTEQWGGGRVFKGL